MLRHQMTSPGPKQLSGDLESNRRLVIALTFFTVRVRRSWPTSFYRVERSLFCVAKCPVASGYRTFGHYDQSHCVPAEVDVGCRWALDLKLESALWGRRGSYLGTMATRQVRGVESNSSVAYS